MLSSARLKMEQDFSPEDGRNMFLRNVGIYIEVHMALKPRRPTWILHDL
jgi:hypothetical protein